MNKGLAVSAVLVLLLLSSANAGVLNMQGLGFGVGNSVVVTGGDGGAGNTNLLTVGTSQTNNDPGQHITTYQDTAGALTQAASASAAAGGAIGVAQNGIGSAWQIQNQPGYGPGWQDQDLVAILDQDIVDAGGGTSSAVGLQNFVGIQTQVAFTMWGASANVQAIGVTLFDAVGGGPGGAAISGAAQVGVGQGSGL